MIYFLLESTSEGLEFVGDLDSFDLLLAGVFILMSFYIFQILQLIPIFIHYQIPLIFRDDS